MRNKPTFKTLRSVLIAAAFVALSPAASATSATNTVSDVTIESGTQYARIGINGGPFGGRPACHNAAFGSHWGFDISTSKGKALLATAQAALLSGKRVSVTGTTTCTTVGGWTLETLTALTIYAI